MKRATPGEESWSAGVDIGGTFTDIIALDKRTRSVHVDKTLTTPEDPSDGFMTGLHSLAEKSGFEIANVADLIHGTTLVTNAVLERKGAKTALITTAGFRDVLSLGYSDTLELRKEMRYDIYDLNLQFAPVIIPRFLRKEVDERMLADGSEYRPVDKEQAASLVRELVDEQGVESIAVCLLHSYANPSHEIEVREIAKKVSPDLHVSISSEILPQIREYERMVTTAINAFVKPVVEAYVDRLQDRLSEDGFKGNFFIMTSSGGVVAPEVAKAFPVRLLESGPVAGVFASTFLMREVGLTDAFTFDMGGTTSKGCVVRGLQVSMSNEFETARFHEFRRGSGMPVLIPNVKLIEIGVGGGSIASLDDRGVIQVGPESAGAKPGPACYALGGTSPTLCDAHLILGYLNPRGLLGGEMALRPDLAEAAMKREIADPLGISVAEAAWGVYERSNEETAKAFRIHAAESGIDYRNHSLIAFGGCGQMNAVRIARKMGFGRVLMPLRGGVFSSLGLLVTPVSFDFSRTQRAGLRGLSLQSYAEAFSRMADEGRKVLNAAGVPRESITIDRSLDMRYQGQGYEIEVEAGRGEVTGAELRRLASMFETRYRDIYSLAGISEDIEIVNFKVRASGPMPKVKLPSFKDGGSSGMTRPKEKRNAYFERVRFEACPVYGRNEMRCNQTFRGPAILEERESTTVVEPGWEGRVDALGDVALTRVDDSR